LMRLGWGVSRPGQLDDSLPDQQEYLSLGKSLLREGQLKFYDARFYQEVYAYRTPGYPLLIAACGGSVRAVRAVQAVLDTSTVLATYLLARRWLVHGAAWLAAALMAFNPFLIYFSGLILSETLFTAMLVWGAVLLVRQCNYMWGGIVLALSVLVRPAAVALPIGMGIISAL